jgi:hypothetical protein
LKEHGAGHVPIGVDLIAAGHDAYGKGLIFHDRRLSAQLAIAGSGR